MAHTLIVPELVTKAREGRGLSMRDVQKRMKIKCSLGTLHNIEAGKHQPRLDRRVALIGAIGTTDDEISLPLDELKKRKEEFPKFFLQRVQ